MREAQTVNCSCARGHVNHMGDANARKTVGLLSPSGLETRIRIAQPRSPSSGYLSRNGFVEQARSFALNSGLASLRLFARRISTSVT